MSVGALAVPHIVTARKTAGPLRIGFYTDLHMRTEWQSPAGWQQAARMLDDQKTDFTICGGDMITDGFDAAAKSLEPRWEVYLQGRALISNDVYPIIGNHDLVGAIPADGSAPEQDPRRVFKEKMKLDSSWYSFDAGGVHFVAIDPFDIGWEGQSFRGYVSAEQQEWIKRDLSGVSKTQPIVLLSHIPLMTSFTQAVKGALAASSVRSVVNNSGDVLHLFSQYNLVAVLSGHLHVNETLRWKNTTFITGGAICGSWWRGPRHGTQEGFGVVTIEGNQVGWEYIDYQWEARRPPNK
jgi:3',5'-cyclic AMP phosphodiesterase CpdA